MPRIIAAALLTLLAPFLATAQPVALPLPVTVISVELDGCAEVMQSSASCPLPVPTSGEIGTITGTAILTNPNGRVEMNISGNVSAVTSNVTAAGRAPVLMLEIEVPANAEAAAMEVTVSTPRPVGIDRMETFAHASYGLLGSSAAFGDGFHIEPNIVALAEDPEPTNRHRRIVVLPELASGDIVRLPMSFTLRLAVPPGGSASFDETAVLEFKYLPAPEPPAESGLGAGLVFLLALGAWRRRSR